MNRKAFQKESRKTESDVKISENPSDFGFAKKQWDSDNIRIGSTPTHHIPITTKPSHKRLNPISVLTSMFLHLLQTLL